MAERFSSIRRNDDDLFIEDLYNQIELLVESHKAKPLGIILTGRSETGKSELLAALMGINETKKHTIESSDSNSDDSDSDSDSELKQVIDEQEFTKEGIRVTVWDCPGLQDGVDDEETYLENLKEKCGNNADLMLYCIDMAQRRFADEFAIHNSAVDKITRTLGRDIWSRTLVVLTRGNILAEGLEKTNPNNIEEEFNRTIHEWKTRFMEALQNANVDKKVIKKIQVQPAGYYTGLHLPGREHWLSNLWSYVFTTTDPDAQTKIMLLNFFRLKDMSTFDEQKSSAECGASVEQSIVLTNNVMSAIKESSVPSEASELAKSVIKTPSESQKLPLSQDQLLRKPLTSDPSSTAKADKKPTYILDVILGMQKGIGLSVVLGFLKSRIQAALTKKGRVDLREPCNEAQV